MEAYSRAAEAHLGGRAFWAVEADPEEVETHPGTVDDQLWTVEAHSDTQMAHLWTCLKADLQQWRLTKLHLFEKGYPTRSGWKREDIDSKCKYPISELMCQMVTDTSFHKPECVGNLLVLLILFFIYITSSDIQKKVVPITCKQDSNFGYPNRVWRRQL